jgi:hypothetical protein
MDPKPGFWITSGILLGTVRASIDEQTPMQWNFHQHRSTSNRAADNVTVGKLQSCNCPFLAQGQCHDRRQKAVFDWISIAVDDLQSLSEGPHPCRQPEQCTQNLLVSSAESTERLDKSQLE